MVERRKDPQDKKSVPSRGNSKMDAAEQELWNLDDAGPGDAPEGTPGNLEAGSDDIDASGGNGNENEDGFRPAQGDHHEDPEDAPRISVDPKSDSDTPASGDSHPADGEPPRRTASGTGEKIALGILGVILLVAAIWGISAILSPLQHGGDHKQIEFPVVGTAITIRAADTYWRAPDRDQDIGIRLDTRLLPAAVITLQAGTGSGALRFFFLDENNDIVGDATTQVVSTGRFESNGTDSIEIYSTAGFLDPGDHAAYTTGQIDTWHLEIREGPYPDAARMTPGSEFKTVALVPISFNRK